MNSHLVKHLHSLPKAELHAHFEGTVSHKRLIALSEKNGVELSTPVVFPNRKPIAPPPDLAQGYPEKMTFSDFIGVYLKITEVIKTKEDFLSIARDYAKSAEEQSIRYSELYITPTTFISLGFSPQKIFEYLLAAEELFERESKTTVRWIFDIVRGRTTDGSETLKLAEEARDYGVSVLCLGLAGDEQRASAAQFAKTFNKARRMGFNTTAHAGETRGAESIREVVDHLQPERIGHALSVLEDPALVRELKATQTTIEINLWSNIQLGLVTPEEHSLLQMIDAGLNTIICSDDPGIFGKTLVDNYLLAANLGVELERLERMAEKSLEFEKITLMR